MHSIQKITGELDRVGFCVQPGFLTEATVAVVCKEMGTLLADGQFKSAGIGNRKKYKKDETVRRDLIHWLEPGASTAIQDQILLPLEALRLACSRELFLGLSTMEGHYAIYEPGGFYRRHLDSFRDDDSRILSVVLYLNQNWVQGDGGELLLHTAEPVTIQPIGGTLVAFLSHEIEHEVLEAHKVRKSFAGWFTNAERGSRI